MAQAKTPLPTVDISGLRILIVDDQSEARHMLRNILSNLKIFQVFEAVDGREALQFIDIAPEAIDLVVCDWNMPQMSGVDLLRQIRTVDPDMPFLMLTGRGDMDSIVEAKSLGVSGYVRKPFSQTQLEAKLRIIYHRASLAGRVG